MHSSVRQQDFQPMILQTITIMWDKAKEEALGDGSFCVAILQANQMVFIIIRKYYDMVSHDPDQILLFWKGGKTCLFVAISLSGFQVA